MTDADMLICDSCKALFVVEIIAVYPSAHSSSGFPGPDKKEEVLNALLSSSNAFYTSSSSFAF